MGHPRSYPPEPPVTKKLTITFGVAPEPLRTSRSDVEHWLRQSTLRQLEIQNLIAVGEPRIVFNKNSFRAVDGFTECTVIVWAVGVLPGYRGSRFRLVPVLWDPELAEPRKNHAMGRFRRKR